jgi:hypothetical protein
VETAEKMIKTCPGEYFAGYHDVAIFSVLIEFGLQGSELGIINMEGLYLEAGKHPFYRSANGRSSFSASVSTVI